MVTASKRHGSLASQARRLLDEFSGNRRAQAGLAVIALLLAALGWSRLDTAVERLRREEAQQRQLLERIVALRGEGQWVERAAASDTLRRALEDRLWPAESEGAAAANLSDFVTNVGRQAGLINVQVKVDIGRPKPLPGDYRQLLATVSALPSVPSLLAFLDRLQQEPHLLRVERLVIQQQPLPRLDLTLVALARLPPASGSGP